MATTEVNRMLAAAAAAAEDKKAEDIRILALDPADSGLADYLMICNGTNDRQNVAITDEIELRLKREFGEYPSSVEGRRQGDWVVMDYMDFIVHVFSPEKRAYYGLERLRKSATSISVDDLNAEVRNAVKSTRKKAAAKEPKAPLKKPTAAAKKTATKRPAAKNAVKKTTETKVPAGKKTAPAAVGMKAISKKSAKKSASA